MWKLGQKLKLRKLLLLLLVLCLFLQQVLAQPASSAKSNTQTQQIELNAFLEMDSTSLQDFMSSSNNDSKSLMNTENKLTQSNSQSQNAASLLINQDLLLDSLEAQWKNLELQVQALEIHSSSLEKDNKQLNSMLDNSKKTILDLRQNLDDYKKALSSNRNDTSYIIGLFAETQDELNKIKEYVALVERDRKKLRGVRVTSIVFTAVGAGLIVGSQISTDETAKRAMFWAGIGSAVSSGTTLGLSFLF